MFAILPYVYRGKNVKIKDLVLHYGLIEEKLLEEILDPYAMT